MCVYGGKKKSDTDKGIRKEYLKILLGLGLGSGLGLGLLSLLDSSLLSSLGLGLLSLTSQGSKGVVSLPGTLQVTLSRLSKDVDLSPFGLQSVLDREDRLNDKGTDNAKLEVQEDHEGKTDESLLLGLGVLFEVIVHVGGGDELGLLARHGLGLVKVLEDGGVLLGLDPALDQVREADDESLGGDVGAENDLLCLCVLKVQTVGDLHRAHHDGHVHDLCG